MTGELDQRVVDEAQRLRDENARREAERAAEATRHVAGAGALAERLLAEALANVPTDAEADARRLAELEAERNRAERARRRQNVEASGVTGIDDVALDLILRGELSDSVHAYRIVDAWVDVHEGRRKAKGGNVPPRWLALSGGTGCGKTTSSAHAIARLGGLHAHAALLVDAKSSRFPPDREFYARCLRARLLVVDDVGSGNVALDLERAMLEHVLDSRQRAPALTILTTNLERADFDKRIGGRLVSRWAKQGSFAGCKGGDLRLARPA